MTLTDTGIRYTMWQISSYEGHTTEAPAEALIRGEVAIFKIDNKGKHAHNFEVLGKRTHTLAPGAKARFEVALLRRGTFRFESTLDKGRHGFEGSLRVY